MTNGKLADQKNGMNRKQGAGPADEKATDHPLVTAIIPTLERPKFLQQALESVRAQTYSPIEVVVISDPSEAVKEVVEDAKSRMTTEITHITNEEPVGLSKARNQGIDEAAGRYVAFLDDDDLWHSEKTRRQVQSIKTSEQRVGAIYCGRQTFSLYWEHQHTRRPKADGDLFEELLVGNLVGSPSGVLAQTDAVREVGGFDSSIRYHEDWEFYLRFSRNYQWSCIRKPLFTRIAHPDAMSRDTDAKQDARRRIIHSYRTELRERGLYEKAMHNHYLQTGLDHCKEGETDRGRQMFRAAIASRVTLAAVVLYFSTLLGVTGFRVLTWMNRVIAAMRQGGSAPELPLDAPTRIDMTSPED